VRCGQRPREPQDRQLRLRGGFGSGVSSLMVPVMAEGPGPVKRVPGIDRSANRTGRSPDPHPSVSRIRVGPRRSGSAGRGDGIGIHMSGVGFPFRHRISPWTASWVGTETPGACSRGACVPSFPCASVGFRHVQEQESKPILPGLPQHFRRRRIRARFRSFPALEAHGFGDQKQTCPPITRPDNRLAARSFRDRFDGHQIGGSGT